MHKIMLVIDDYAELVALETFLKKLGFDVLGINKDAAYGDAILGFLPELVIASTKSRQVDGIKLSQRVKKITPHAKMALLHPRGQAPAMAAEERSRINAFIETPIDHDVLIHIIAQAGSMDGQILLEKYAKIKGTKFESSDQKSRILKEEKAGKAEEPAGGEPSGSGPEPVNRNAAPDAANASGNAAAAAGPGGKIHDPARAARYKDFLEKMQEPVTGVLSHDDMAGAIKELSDAAKGEEAHLADIDAQKRAFAKALFKK